MPDSFAQEILDALEPMLYDPATAPLTTYIEGLSRPYQLVEDWASDTDTDVGWSLLLDVDRCPDEALPWLGQIVGISNLGSLVPDDQRELIRNLVNWKRGTLGAMATAAFPYLTGTKTVIIRERYDGTVNDAPYYMEAITFTPETPDPAIVEAAIRAQKPAGIVLTYMSITGQDFQLLKTNYATFQAIKDAFLTFEGVKANIPGT